MRVDLMIARRLKLNDSGSRRSAMSIRISVAGVALSLIIMLLTIAIVTGFKNQITQKLTGFESQISISAACSTLEKETPVKLDETLTKIISEAVPDATVTSAILQPAMLKTAGDFDAVVMRAYGAGKDWSFVVDNILEGKPPDLSGEESSNALVISQITADHLGLKLGDKVNACFFIDGRMRLRNMEIAAIYCSNFSDYDKIVAYAPMATLTKLRGLDAGEASRIEINGLPTDEIPDLQLALQTALNKAYYSGEIDEWLNAVSVNQAGAMYFNWLDLLDTNVVVIITLMSLISVFTLIASLFIIILERVNTIGTLKTIGAPDSLIRRIFIILVSKILVRGLLIGNVIALTFCFLQYHYHLMSLDPEAYYISFVPIKISAWQVLTLNIGAIAVALAAMIVPSMVISRMSPSRTVRFE